MTLRLTLFCHAATAATRAAAFPADEPIEPGAAGNASALAASLGRVDAAWTSPALRARQTAAALGLQPAIEPALREIEYGRWAGRGMEGIAAGEPAAFAAWIADPEAAPHGGESIAALLRRVSSWLGALPPEAARVVAVTHASVLRAAVVAALGAGPAAFWRIDVPPLCRLRLHGDRGAWTLRSIGAAPAAAAPTPPPTLPPA